MANVSPPRIVRVPAPGPGDVLGPALREAFGARQDRLPAFLERLIARLRLRG
jgi:hypothetical protein